VAAVAQRVERSRGQQTILPASLRPMLRLVPSPRRRSAPRDGLYALTISALLATGIVVVLLLNTAMQTQADRIALSKQHLSKLALQIQTMSVELDRQGVPAVLAARAQALHMRPATRLPVLDLPRRAVLTLPTPRPARPHLSARERAALRDLAG
jgi:hypothetical protein